MTIPQKLIDKALSDYEKTKSVHKTAKRVGLGSTTVHRLLKAHGVFCDGLALHRQRIRKLPEKATLLADYASGLSESAIAEKYGCHRVTVHEALRKYGAKMRPRGNWERMLTEEEAREIVTQYQQLGSQAAVAALAASKGRPDMGGANWKSGRMIPTNR